MADIFENPQDFLTHLEARVADADQLDEKTKINLLHGSMHAIRYLIESQHILTETVYNLVLCLNSSDYASWAERLADIYRICHAGDVDAADLERILRQEICGDKSS